MAKTATINLRVEPVRKAKAELILNELGISMSTAIDMFLRQIVMTKGIPFSIAMPKEINADAMSVEELKTKLRHGYDQAVNGESKVAEEVFEGFRAAHR